MSCAHTRLKKRLSSWSPQKPTSLALVQRSGCGLGSSNGLVLLRFELTTTGCRISELQLKALGQDLDLFSVSLPLNKLRTSELVLCDFSGRHNLGVRDLGHTTALLLLLILVLPLLLLSLLLLLVVVLVLVLLVVHHWPRPASCYGKGARRATISHAGVFKRDEFHSFDSKVLPRQDVQRTNPAARLLLWTLRFFPRIGRRFRSTSCCTLRVLRPLMRIAIRGLKEWHGFQNYVVAVRC